MYASRIWSLIDRSTRACAALVIDTYPSPGFVFIRKKLYMETASLMASLASDPEVPSERPNEASIRNENS